MGGIGPGEYLSSAVRAGCLFAPAWSQAASSRRAKRDCLVEGVAGESCRVDSPRELLVIGVCGSWPRVGRVVGGLWAGGGGAMGTSRSRSCRGFVIGVLTCVLGWRNGDGGCWGELSS